MVILDNLVLNVEEFMMVHPGGRFVMKRVIGTDISKFFFGGYCMEGNLEGVSPGYNHSSYARMIVNDLAFAIYEGDIPVTREQVHMSQSQSKEIKKSLKNVVLEHITVQEAFHSFYDDERMLGKHFRVQHCDNLDLSRHYTISNVMSPQIYTSYCGALLHNEPLGSECLDS